MWGVDSRPLAGSDRCGWSVVLFIAGMPSTGGKPGWDPKSPVRGGGGQLLPLPRRRQADELDRLSKA
jgi:hypothetical protein